MGMPVAVAPDWREATDAFHTVPPLHSESPIIPIPSPHFGSGGVVGADLVADFRLDQDGCGEQGLPLGAVGSVLILAIGESACGRALFSRREVELPPPGYVRTPEP